MNTTTPRTDSGSPDFVRAAEAAGLTVRREESYNLSWSEIVIGTVAVQASPTKQWRDLGEGPSWQESYEIREDTTVELLFATGFGLPVNFSYPVVSTLRQGGAKYGGVAVAVRDDVTERPSTHRHAYYGYQAFRAIAATGELAGWAVTLDPRVHLVEKTYAHDETRTSWALYV